MRKKPKRNLEQFILKVPDKYIFGTKYDRRKKNAK
jgi:hypothetical protein